MGARPTGELTFQALDQNFVLVFDFNALCDIEDALDLPIAKLDEVLQTPRMRTVRTIFRIGLSRHHPKVTDDSAGKVIGDLSIQRAVDLISEAFAAAFPTEEAGGAAGARPPVSA